MPRCLLRSKFILSHGRQNNWRRKFAASATVIAEGQTALVVRRTRKVETVFPRWGSRKGNRASNIDNRRGGSHELGVICIATANLAFDDGRSGCIAGIPG